MGIPIVMLERGGMEIPDAAEGKGVVTVTDVEVTVVTPPDERALDGTAFCRLCIKFLLLALEGVEATASCVAQRRAKA